MTTDTIHFRTIRIHTEHAKAATIALLHAVAGTDPIDERTWHGGLGADLCDHCCALVVLRHAAGYSAADHLRP